MKTITIPHLEFSLLLIKKLINEKNYHTTLKAGLSEENFGLKTCLKTSSIVLL